MVILCRIMLRHYLRNYIPAVPKLLKSFKLRSKEYLRENTLHGFAYFINPYRPIWERAIWFICTIASLGAALGIIVNVWQRFQSAPTFTDLDIQTENMAIIYPGIHLCMTSNHLILTGVSEESANTYKTYYNLNWKLVNHSQAKLQQPLSKIFQQKTPNCNNLLRDCIEDGNKIDCGQLFIKSLTPVGICCKSLPRKFNGKLELPFLSFIPREEKLLNLYIHDIDEPPLRISPISYRLDRNIDVILKLFVTKAADGLRMLSRSQRQCVFDDEGLSYNACYSKCVIKESLKICDCIPWFLANETNSNECNLNQYSCFLNRVKATDCIANCYSLCDHTDYTFTYLKNSDNLTTIKIWRPTVRFERKIRFGWLDLLVSFGGIMGLFLGYSLLTSVELIYYFSLRFYCGAVLDRSQSVNIEKIHVAERKQPKAIPIKYYDYVE